MDLNELEYRIKHLKQSGVPGTTQVVKSVPDSCCHAAVDIMGLQQEEITYSSSLEAYKINTTGIPHPHGKEAIVL